MIQARDVVRARDAFMQEEEVARGEDGTDIGIGRLSVAQLLSCFASHGDHDHVLDAVRR